MVKTSLVLLLALGGHRGRAHPADLGQRPSICARSRPAARARARRRSRRAGRPGSPPRSGRRAWRGRRGRSCRTPRLARRPDRPRRDGTTASASRPLLPEPGRQSGCFSRSRSASAETSVTREPGDLAERRESAWLAVLSPSGRAGERPDLLRDLLGDALDDLPRGRLAIASGERIAHHALGDLRRSGRRPRPRPRCAAPSA